MVIATAVIGAIAVAIAREGPDVSTVGRVSVVEAHRLCVTDADGVEHCAHVDEPNRVQDVRVGDCVRARRSGSDILERVDPASDCR